MKRVLQFLFIVFIVWVAIGMYLVNTEHEKGQIVMGLAVFFFSFIFMPLFIYHRYRKGKYKKYVLNDRTLLGKMKDMDDK